MAPRRLTREEKKAQTREDILRAAVQVFPRRGFHRTSVDQVAEYAGLSIGAVYSNFAGKAELFLALYQRQMDRWVTELPRPLDVGGSVADLIRAADAYWSGFLQNERDWFLVHMEFWAYVVREPGLREQYAVQFRRLRLALSAVLQQAADERQIALLVPADDLAAALLALVRGLLIETLADPGAVSPDLFSALLDILANTPVSPRPGADPLTAPSQGGATSPQPGQPG